MKALARATFILGIVATCVGAATIALSAIRMTLDED